MKIYINSLELDATVIGNINENLTVVLCQDRLTVVNSLGCVLSSTDVIHLDGYLPIPKNQYAVVRKEIAASFSKLEDAEEFADSCNHLNDGSSYEIEKYDAQDDYDEDGYNQDGYDEKGVHYSDKLSNFLVTLPNG